MLEAQGVLGRIQLRRMDQWQQARLANARKIWAAAEQLPGLRVPAIPEDCLHAAYKCYVFVEPAALKADWTRDRILNEIAARGEPCFSGSCSEVYLEKAFDDTPWRPKERLPVALQLGETSLMFMVHPTLTTAEIDKTCQVLRDVMQEAQGV
jgi:dTDP-4-amino-4,6-dideoxygalactose transaminase